MSRLFTAQKKHWYFADPPPGAAQRETDPPSSNYKSHSNQLPNFSFIGILRVAVYAALKASNHFDYSVDGLLREQQLNEQQLKQGSFETSRAASILPSSKAQFRM